MQREGGRDHNRHVVACVKLCTELVLCPLEEACAVPVRPAATVGREGDLQGLVGGGFERLFVHFSSSSRACSAATAYASTRSASVAKRGIRTCPLVLPQRGQ